MVIIDVLLMSLVLMMSVLWVPNNSYRAVVYNNRAASIGKHRGGSLARFDGLESVLSLELYQMSLKRPQ